MESSIGVYAVVGVAVFIATVVTVGGFMHRRLPTLDEYRRAHKSLETYEGQQESYEEQQARFDDNQQRVTRQLDRQDALLDRIERLLERLEERYRAG